MKKNTRGDRERNRLMKRALSLCVGDFLLPIRYWLFSNVFTIFAEGFL